MNPLKKEALDFKHPFYPGKAQGSYHTTERFEGCVYRNVSAGPRVHNEKEFEEAVKKGSSSTV